MKKFAIRFIRTALKFLPKKIKNKLKQNEVLTSLYIKSVRRSGLFFDAPTTKQTHQLYSQWQEINRASLAPRSIKKTGWQAVVFGNGAHQKTMKSLFELGAENVVFLDSCFNASNTTNLSGLDVAKPTLLLNVGDTLQSNAIFYLLEAFKSGGVVYCDTDQISDNGDMHNPRFLPSWNPDLLYSSAYVNTGVLVDTSLLRGMILDESKSIAEVLADLSLNNAELTVDHIALPLVHTKESVEGKLLPLRGVSNSLLKKTGAAVILDGKFGVNRIKWPHSDPFVSLIIPTKNGKTLVKACIESILSKTTYKNYEILLIDNGSDEQESIDYFDYLNSLDRVEVLKYPLPFNYSAINNFGVSRAKGSIIGLINNDIEVITPEWLTYMVGHVERPEVGCVGAKLLYSDGRIQHAGVIMGYGGGAGHAHKNFPRFHKGYLNRIVATSNFSAVTAACLLVKRVQFEEVGGLNEVDLPVAFNDVDFCLRVKELGVNNVYCSDAELYHHESVSRGLDLTKEKAARFNRELSYLQSTWKHYIECDPAYSPNLTLKRENFSIKTKEELCLEL